MLKKSPTVFISYSHDSEEHKLWVLALARKLHTSGIKVVLDQWNLRLGSDLATFMEQGLSESTRVICVCSEKYVQKANFGEGGVRYEKQIMTSKILKNIDSNWVIPIIKNNIFSAEKLPIFLGGRLYLDFEDKDLYNENIEILCREIFNNPKNSPPPLGENPYKDRKTKVVKILGNPLLDRYRKFLENKYCYVKILGMNQPMPLRRIYVRVKILDKVTSSQRSTIEGLESSFVFETGFQNKESKSINGLNLINKSYYEITKYSIKLMSSGGVPKSITSIITNFIHTKTFKDESSFSDFLLRNVDVPTISKYKDKVIKCCKVPPKHIILGKPGAGKTTFLKFLLLSALDDNLEEKYLPVFVSLKDLSDSKLSLLEFISKQLKESGVENSLTIIRQYLEEGKCLILLDGLDEVGKSSQDNVINEIKRFSDEFFENAILITCRIAAYNYIFENFQEVELADFNIEQVEDFVLNWFSEDYIKADNCLREIIQNRVTSQLSNVPLLLTLFCLVYEHLLSFPANRAELYREALDVLLKKWDSSRGIKRDNPYKELSLGRKESLFCVIAADTFEKGNYFIKEKYLEDKIKSFLDGLSGLKTDNLDIVMILKSIEAQHGIFVERANKIYSFSHLTIQEYFTARYIINQENVLSKAVDLYLFDRKWREVFLLSAGLLSDADKFVYFIKKRLFNPNIVNFLKFIDEIENKESPYSSSESKMLNIKYMIETYQHKLTSRKRDDILLALEKIRSFPINRNSIPAHARDIKNITKFEYSFTGPELLALNEYLYGTLILIECLNAECYISKEMREFINESLYKEPMPNEFFFVKSKSIFDN